MHASDDMDERQSQFEIRLTHTLESAPEVTIPTDFATRVMARVPTRRVHASARSLPVVNTTHIARNVALASIAVLACLLLAVMFTMHQTAFVAYALEPLLALQLGALLYWQMVRPQLQ